MTSPLKSITTALNIVINSFESMQDASSRAIDTKSLQAAREELSKASVAFDSIEQNIADATNKQQKFNAAIHSGTSAADGLWSKIKGIAAAAGGIAAVKGAFSLSDKVANTTARLNLLVDDGGSVEELQQKIMASAERSRSSYLDTANVVAKMGLNAGNAFANNDELIAFSEQVNKMFVIGGATAQEQSSAMLQLTQAMAAGALRGEELNSILEGAPGIARAIEQYMGWAEGSIKDYASQGLVTAEVVKNALFSIAEETNKKIDLIPETWRNVWDHMQNWGLMALDPLLKKISALANNEKTTAFVKDLIGGLRAVATVAGGVLDLIVGIGTAIYDNWSWIAPIILGVATAFLAYHGIVLAVNAAQAISNGLDAVAALQKNAHAAATSMAAGATFMQTTAQYGLNAALLACPLTWILIIIIAIVAVVYAVVAAINKFAGTSISATGVICGAFAFAGAVIANIFIGMQNFIIGGFIEVWNLIATFANAIATAFNNPVAAIIELFAGMFDFILGIVQSAASLIDTVLGSDLSGAVEGFRNTVADKVSEIVGDDRVEIVKKLDASDYKIDRFKYGDAFNSGYKFGEGIDNAVGGLFDTSFLDDLLNGKGSETPWDGIEANTGDTAANTAASADKMEFAEEDLKYMRDIAEREAINRFTTAQVTINQNNTNHLASNMDLDGVMNAWTNEFAEKMLVSSEGVHT